MAATERPRVFRLFVSSTFRDLEAERDVLVERVYPELREFCAEHGARFQPIDLRWGVSEEASLDQQAMNICLGEIEHCREVTSRPNFLVLLGNRYGWLAPPPQIPADEFERIRGRAPNEGRDLLDEWYLRDDNAVADRDREQSRADESGWQLDGDVATLPEYVLRPREQDGPFEEYGDWEPVERRLLATLVEAAAGTELEGRPRYGASATEQEVIRGALELGAPEGRAFCFAREIELQVSDPDPEAATANEPILTFVDPDQAPIERLKEQLRESESVSYKRYGVKWNPDRDRPASGHLEKLADDVCAELKDAIRLEFAEPTEPPGRAVQEVRIEPHEHLDGEGEAHRAFAEEQIRFFVGREDLLARVADYLASSDPHPLILHGDSGTGKSALIAETLRRAQLRPHTDLVYRFIGATPGSSDARGLLEGICRELARRYGENAAEVPTGFQDLAADFRRRLTRYGPMRPLVLMIGAVDQLVPSPGAPQLSWIPERLPEGVRIVLSTRPDEMLEHRSTQLVEVGPLSRHGGAELLELWLADAGRTLRADQRSAVLDAFEASGSTPLYLRLAFEEARRWSSEQEPEVLGRGIEEIIKLNTFDRLAQEHHHGEVLVSRALGYLGASRHGLAEDELLDLLSRDPAVYRWFVLGGHHLPIELRELLDAYLSEEVKEELRETAERGPGSGQVDELAEWIRQIRDGERDEGEFERILAEILPRQGGGGLRLPAVLWSRLHADLRGYLTERNYEDGVLIGFYHRELARVARERYLGVVAGERRAGDGRGLAYHGRLADYFRPEQDSGGRASWRDASLHALSELPFHLTRAGEERRSELEETLTDFGFLEEKVQEVGRISERDAGGEGATTYSGVQLLQDDFDLAVEEISRRRGADPGRQILGAFGRDLRREAHLLSRRPELIWQQLQNRLQWEGGAVEDALAPQRRRRSELAGRPWLRTRTRPHESEALARVLEGHGGWVRSCAVSPDGSFIVSAASDGTVRVWDAITGAERHALEGHAGSVEACAVSPDNSYVVSAGEDGTVRLWDANTGLEQRRLAGHTGSVWTCAVSPDGSFIVSGGADETVRVWDATTGAERHTLRGHTFGIRACAVSPDSSHVVSAGDDETARVWDAATGAQSLAFTGHTGPVEACVVSPDGAFVASAGRDRKVRIWDPATGVERLTLVGHTGYVRACAVSPDSSFVVSTGDDQATRVWDAATGEERHTLVGHTYGVRACVVSPDGALIVTASADKTLRVWDGRLAAAVEGRVAGHTGPVRACAVAPDGSFVASASDDGTLRLWDAATGAERRTLTGHTGPVRHCAVAPDGSFVASASDDGTLRLWDAVTGAEQRTLTGHTGPVRACEVSPDGSFVVSAGDDGTLRLWDADTGLERHRLTGHTRPVRACAVSPDGSFIVSAGNDGTLRLWDAATGVERHALVGHSGYVRACAVAPDGSFVVSASDDGTLRLWDADTGAAGQTLTGHTHWVETCAVAPDGSFVVSASDDGTLRLWDSATGAERHTLTGHTHWVEACAVSPDGSLVVSASRDRTLRLWDSGSGHELAALGVSGPLRCVAVDPRGGYVVAGDAGGGVYLAELKAIEIGAPIIGGVDRGLGLPGPEPEERET